MSRTKQDRKYVEVARKRVPLRKLFHGKEIRAAAQELENYRLHLNEAEFLYGAKITLAMDAYGECIAVAKRLETDNEYLERLEKARLAEEAKAERERKKAIAAAEKAKRDEEQRKVRAAQSIKDMAKANGITKEELKTLLDSMLT